MTLPSLMAMLALAVPPENCDPAFRAEPQTHTGPDRHQHNAVGGEGGHAETADDVG